jgi:hypothetical protein
MANKRTTFAKLQRERQKKAKAKAKRERRHQRSESDDEPGVEAQSTGDQPSAADLMERLEVLHKQFDDDEITFEDFEEQKHELLAQLATLPMD